MNTNIANWNSLVTGMNRKQFKAQARKILGTESYLKLQNGARRIKKINRSLFVQMKQFNVNKKSQKNTVRDLPVKMYGGLRWTNLDHQTSFEAYTNNWDISTALLESADIQWWNVGNPNEGRMVLGVHISDRENLLRHLKDFSCQTKSDTYIMNPMAKNPQYLLDLAGQHSEIQNAEVLRICRPTKSSLDGRNYGFAYGCDIEFWETSEDWVTAPRENRASKQISKSDFALAPVDLLGRPALTPSVFIKRMLDDVVFDIDVVYTWVDGNDPGWKAKKNSALGIEDSGDDQFHPEALSDSRFTSRDELMYSLRSVALFAPWVRNIFIVTDDQAPEWLNLNHPRIKIIDHREIMHAANLPTFNSNAIISNIHHIPELSEHFIFFNDDVMLGQPVSKSDFFTPSGLALVSRSNNRRPFGEASMTQGPHFNITRNIRRIIEEHFGITISRAIKHTPHPLLKSVMYEMEEVFKSHFDDTSASKFRHHDDIVADQLHHYYAQIIGKAVPGSLTYNYINILNDQFLNVLRTTLVKRNRQAFCINDAPEPGATPIPDWELTAFFNTYFPKKSEFEI